jgi:hypothetical protein
MRPTSKDIKETRALAKNLCPCNYSGECVLLDECACIVQSSPYSLAEGKILCRYFEQNVLPADPHLQSLFGEFDGRYIKCKNCGKSFIPSGNNQKFCHQCKDDQQRKRNAAHQRRYRANG